MSCPSRERLAAWLLGEHDSADEQSLEEHLFACDDCANKAQAIQALIQQLRATLPPLLTPERRRVVEESVSPLPVVAVSPGERRTITLSVNAQLGLWVIRADLQSVNRVDCKMLAPDGTKLMDLLDVPFDAQRGELVLACQAHYRHLGWPPEMIVRINAVDDSGERELGEYRLNHLFTDV